MRRRTVVLGAAAGAMLAMLSPHAQPPGRTYRIGWLFGDRQAVNPVLEAFVAAMGEQGLVHGEHFVLETRFAEGDPRRFLALARELVAAKADVLLGVETGARAMVQVTRTVPIVLLTSIDPVSAGLVKSLAQPGTNVTGMVDLFDQLIAKHIELLVEISPRTSRIVLLNDRFWSARDSYERYARQAAAAKDLQLDVALLGNAKDVQEAFADFERRRPDGLIVAATGGAILTWRAEIVDGARRLGLPTVYAFERYARDGGLLSYGPNILENAREAAELVARILNGADPARIPLRQTKKFDLVVNLKEARSMGITIPQTILLRADRVIE